jgi:hypothetical protein
VPLANAKEVFSESAARLGELIPRIPDGETGIRTMWILCQKEVMAKTKNLKVHHQFDIAPGVAQTVYEIADPSKPVEFPALNYAAAAKESYRQFTELKKAGEIAATIKFQVSLPTAVAVLSGFIVPESQALVEKPYTDALKKEVDEITRLIPHQDLAIQWDVAHEVLFLSGWQLETSSIGRSSGCSEGSSTSETRSRLTSISDSIFVTAIRGTSILWSQPILTFRSSWPTPSSSAAVARCSGFTCRWREAERTTHISNR